MGLISWEFSVNRRKPEKNGGGISVGVGLIGFDVRG